MAKSGTPEENEGGEHEAFGGADCTDAFYAEAENSEIKRRVVALAVDDDEIARTALVRLLSTCAIHPLEADNGRRALELLRVRHVDIIICDQSMPLMTGIDVLRAARLRFPHVRRVLFTGHWDVTLLIEALNDCDADLVLRKGSSTADLRAKLTYLREGIELARTRRANSTDKSRDFKEP